MIAFLISDLPIRRVFTADEMEQQRKLRSRLPLIGSAATDGEAGKNIDAGVWTWRLQGRGKGDFDAEAGSW